MLPVQLGKNCTFQPYIQYKLYIHATDTSIYDRQQRDRQQSVSLREKATTLSVSAAKLPLTIMLLELLMILMTMAVNRRVRRRKQMLQLSTSGLLWSWDMHHEHNEEWQSETSSQPSHVNWTITSSDSSLAPSLSVSYCSQSDHFPIFTKLSVHSRPTPLPLPTYHSFRRLHSIDTNSFVSDLQSSQLITNPPISLGSLLICPQNLTYCVHVRGGGNVLVLQKQQAYVSSYPYGRSTYCIQITNRLKQALVIIQNAER